MAETFWCGGEAVKFSNGAVELLLAHWLAAIKARPGRPGVAELADFLGRRLRTVGAGGRAFGMDRERVPAELAPPACAALAELINETAADVRQVQGIDWGSAPGLRERWEGRLLQLHRALIAWQPGATHPPES